MPAEFIKWDGVLDMNPKADDGNRSAVPVVAWIRNVLVVNCNRDPAPDMSRVIRLEDLLQAIVQRAIAQVSALPVSYRSRGPIVNLPGFTGDIAFTPEALAGIYLGRIKKWNDPVLAQANRGLRLPDLDIVVVHRSDGSGTTYSWTDYLSKVSPKWKAEVGSVCRPGGLWAVLQTAMTMSPNW